MKGPNKEFELSVLSGTSLPKPKITPYYEEPGIQIFLGDCREILPHLEHVDLVLTDPVWGVGKAEWDKEFCFEWGSLILSLYPSCLAIMPGIVNIPKMTDTLGPLRYRWTLAAYLINGMTRGAIGFGNWIACMVYATDEISIFSQGQDCKTFSIGAEKKVDHPCPKPINVMRWFLSLLPGETILDPFMGSGTTLRAAKDLGRKAIGIEIEEKYVKIAIERLRQGVLL
jgi:site-specific DNA-methyltransferase (adenine-specific)